MKPFQNFAEFYPYYLSEHRHRVCRLLHFIGSLGVLSIVLITLFTQHWWLLCLMPAVGYGFAWIGHFGFEKNKPATFQYPLYSFWGDWRMFIDIIRGKVKF